jgi:hypothetical protein
MRPQKAGVAVFHRQVLGKGVQQGIAAMNDPGTGD